MKLFVKFDIHKACNVLLEQQMKELGLDFQLLGAGEILIKGKLSISRIEEINQSFSKYGMEIIEEQKSILIQKIKDAIVEMVYMDDELPAAKSSHYLAEKLGYSYGHLSNLFSEHTFTSIENFIILQKTERAKQLIGTNEFTFTEIAWKLNYSSVAHFSTQFKNTTGLTPSMFQKIVNKRKAVNTN